MKVADVGILIYQKLTAIPEFTLKEPVASAPADEVERALVELTETTEVGAATLHIATDRRTRYFRITIWPANSELAEFEVEGATLTEAMQSVREWKAKEKS